MYFHRTVFLDEENAVVVTMTAIFFPYLSVALLESLLAPLTTTG